MSFIRDQKLSLYPIATLTADFCLHKQNACVDLECSCNPYFGHEVTLREEKWQSHRSLEPRLALQSRHGFMQIIGTFWWVFQHSLRSFTVNKLRSCRFRNETFIHNLSCFRWDFQCPQTFLYQLTPVAFAFVISHWQRVRLLFEGCQFPESRDLDLPAGWMARWRMNEVSTLFTYTGWQLDLERIVHMFI